MCTWVTPKKEEIIRNLANSTTGRVLRVMFIIFLGKTHFEQIYNGKNIGILLMV